MDHWCLARPPGICCTLIGIELPPLLPYHLPGVTKRLLSPAGPRQGATRELYEEEAGWCG